MTIAKKRFSRATVAIGLSVTLFLSGNLIFNASSAHAANRDNSSASRWDFNWGNWGGSGNGNTGSGSNSGGNQSGSGSNSGSTSGSASQTASDIIAKGKTFMGVRYDFGAKTGNTKSFDCSSFTQYLYELKGVTLPRTSKEQSKAGTYVPRSQLQPGDLVFFYSPVHHVGIYIGNGKVLHTYGDPGVTIDDLNSGWWDEHYTTARRVIGQ
ncbi:hypothetical protein GCM10020370_23530 [Paenibacillus hodogayensis]